MDARDVADKEADVVVVDFRDDDVLRLFVRLHIEAARQVHERNRLAAEREETIDIRMCLRHGRDRRACDDLTDFRDIDAIMDFANAKFDDFKFIRSSFKKNTFLIS